MNISLVSRPEMLIAALQADSNGHDVRRAWKEVDALLGNHPNRLNPQYGHVLIPEWQWIDGVHSLWVGVEVNGEEGLPAGLELMSIPERYYAKATVQGDRIHMERIHVALHAWLDRNGYRRDDSEGTYRFEANRLVPVNPFELDADQIKMFDFDIYTPIKR